MKNLQAHCFELEYVLPEQIHHKIPVLHLHTSHKKFSMQSQGQYSCAIKDM
jgi:hypothetical protein